MRSTDIAIIINIIGAFYQWQARDSLTGIVFSFGCCLTLSLLRISQDLTGRK